MKAQTPIGREIVANIKYINKLNHEQCCRLWRFAPSGHPYFDKTGEYWKFFKARFDSFGGFTPEMSKKIGWGEIYK
mgnify:CR=1 FL=1|jgi:hypothetical protein